MTPFSFSKLRGRSSQTPTASETTPATSRTVGSSSSANPPHELDNLARRRGRMDSPDGARPLTARASLPASPSSSDEEDSILDSRAWLATLMQQPEPSVQQSPEQKTLVPASAIGGFYASCPNVVGVVDHSKSKLPSQGPAEWFVEPYIRASDGLVRRFPEIRSNFGHFGDQIKKGIIYDGAAHLVTKRYAGLEVSRDGTAPVFVVNGMPMAATKFRNFDVYPISGNRFMVPQPSFKDCSSACELMLLLDHGKVDLTDMNSSTVYAANAARDTAAIAWSIGKATGSEPLQVTHQLNYKSGFFSQDKSRKLAWRDLGKKIEQHGPCILGKGGHVVMLDNVRESKGKFFLSIRDPFHATSIEIQESAEFFSNGTTTPDHAQIDAIFLPRITGAGSSSSGR